MLGSFEAQPIVSVPPRREMRTARRSGTHDSSSFKRIDNRVRVRGALRPDATPILGAALHQAVNEEDHTDIVLDFSRCDGITQAVMLPLMPVVTRYRETGGIRFELVGPNDPVLNPSEDGGTIADDADIRETAKRLLLGEVGR